MQALRERTLDALVVDARSLRPRRTCTRSSCTRCVAPSWCAAAIRCRKRRGGASFDDVLRYPIASTPLSRRGGARAGRALRAATRTPAQCVTLRCEEIPSLVEVARHSDAVLLAIRAAAPDLVELTMQAAAGRDRTFRPGDAGRRTVPPGLAIVRALMAELLVDSRA